MTEYSLSIETSKTTLAGGKVQFEAWVSSCMGFDDPGVFLLHRRRSLVNTDATPLFETFANPCNLVEYPYRFVERNYGMYRDRAVSIILDSRKHAEAFEAKLEDRRGKLVSFMNEMSSSLESASVETVKGVEIRASRNDQPFMMIKAVCTDGSDPFVFQVDGEVFSRFVGIYGETNLPGIRKDSLEIITYSTRAPIFLDLLRTDLTGRP